MKIDIKNLRGEKPRNPWDIVIDRRSVFGNPFYMRNEAERDEVCDKHKELIMGNLETFIGDFLILYELYHKYGQLNLFCWCAPKRCHGETIREILLALKKV